MFLAELFSYFVGIAKTQQYFLNTYCFKGQRFYLR